MSPLTQRPVFILAPVRRLQDLPGWGKVAASAGYVWQYILTDMFAGALTLCMLASIFDYIFGVKAARKNGGFSMAVAKAGVFSKFTGVALTLLVRLLEAWAEQHAIISTHGAIGTAVAISLFAIELQSIANHREALGGGKIPIIGKIVEWIHQWSASKVPKQ